MPIDSEGRRLRARVAALRRHHPDHPDLEPARRTLKAAALERSIREGPPLDLQQRAKLAGLLLLAPGDAP